MGPAGPGLHEDALRVLRGWVAPDDAQERLRTSYVEHLCRHRDGHCRSCVPAHLTASAIVVDATGDRVLLALHRKGGFWVQLGGHCEPGDQTLAGAALREAGEESGIEGLKVVGCEPLDLDRHRLSVAFGSCGEHLDVRYLVVAPAGAEPVTSDESHDVRWFGRDELPAGVADGLGRLVARGMAAAQAALPG